MNKKDLNNLEGIFMLAAINNFSGKRKASEALGTSIDTINKYVDNLESSLGLKLMFSNDRGSQLTVDGHRVLEEFPKLKEALNNVYGMSIKHGEVKGEVRLAMNLGVRSSIISNKFGAFFDMYPELSVRTVLSDSDPDMRDNSYDMGICYHIPQSGDLVVICSKEIKCGYFASATYLEKFGYPRNLEDMLENHRILAKSGTSGVLKQWKDLMKKAKHLVYSSNSMFDLNDSIRNGVGIGIMPLYFAEEGIVCLDNIKCETDLHFHLIVHKDTKDVPKNRVVIDFYKDILEKM